MQEIEPFEYPGLHGPALCRLRILDAGDRTVVIATELPENTGGRFADTAELLATEVCRRGLVDPERLLLIEHDPGRTAAPAEVESIGRVKPARYELVALHREGTAFARPIWTAFSRTQVQELVGADFPLD